MRIAAVAVLIIGFVSYLYQHGIIGKSAAERKNAEPPPPILSEPTSVVSDEQLEKITRLSQDSDPRVRLEAVGFLEKAQSPKALKLMIEMLQRDPVIANRVVIIDRLSARSGPEVSAALLSALNDIDAPVRNAALRALERTGGDAAVKAITDGPLNDQEESVRLQALHTLNVLQERRQREIEAAKREYETQNSGAIH